MRTVKNSPSVRPDTTSITRPSTSVEWLYSHVAPGWCIRGSLASRSTNSGLLGVILPDLGVQVRLLHQTRSKDPIGEARRVAQEVLDGHLAAHGVELERRTA